MLLGKRKNNEKRREKSRCAARHRREREGAIFTDLYTVVPIHREPSLGHVDRIAVLRLAACLCRARIVAGKLFSKRKIKEEPERHESLSSHLAQCLEGFLLLCDSSGLIVYVSEGVSPLLGFTQTDMTGQILFDYLHPEDMQELQEMALSRSKEEVVKLTLRIKSILGPRGRTLNWKSATYKAVSLHLRIMVSGDDSGEAYWLMYLEVAGGASGVQSDGISRDKFVTRHTADMKFSYCHDRFAEVLGYDARTLIGASYFSLVHPEDLPSLGVALKEMYKKGFCTTTYYRLMAKKGGFVWVAAEVASAMHGPRGHRDRHVICTHRALNFVQGDEVVADVQVSLMTPVSMSKLSSASSSSSSASSSSLSSTATGTTTKTTDSQPSSSDEKARLWKAAKKKESLKRRAPTFNDVILLGDLSRGRLPAQEPKEEESNRHQPPVSSSAGDCPAANATIRRPIPWNPVSVAVSLSAGRVDENQVLRSYPPMTHTGLAHDLLLPRQLCSPLCLLPVFNLPKES